jgi:hypothetical protein
MLTTSQSKVETSICTPFLSISHFCTTFRSPAAQESTGRNQPNRCVLHKARVRWRHRRLRHLCHRKKHSTRQKDKSIEKGITTIWNIYISFYIWFSILLYCPLLSTGFYFIGAFQRVAHCAHRSKPGGYALRAGFGHVKSIMGSGRDTRAWRWKRLESHVVSRWVWLSKPFPRASSAPIRCCSFGQDLFLAGFTNMGFSLERQNLSWSEGASIFRQDSVGYILSFIWFHGSNSSSFGSPAQERPQARGDWGGEVRSHQRKNGWYIQNKQNHVGKTMP